MAYATPEHQRKKKRGYQNGHGKDKHHAAVLAWRERNPHQYRAQQIVKAAVRKGELKKPDYCFTHWCKSKTRIEFHHYDYSNPLDGVWLCQHCHKAVHRMERECRKG